MPAGTLMRALCMFRCMVLCFLDSHTSSPYSTGIGPEVFAFASEDGDYTGSPAPTAEQVAFYKEHGFYPTTNYYILRPEVLESNFYAWRVTGDTKYLDRAAKAVESFRTFLKAPVAYAGIMDVNSRTSDKIDDMESFWFAEVLKYLYVKALSGVRIITNALRPIL